MDKIYMEIVNKYNGDIVNVSTFMNIGQYSEWLISKFNEGYSIENVGTYAIVHSTSTKHDHNYRIYEKR